MRKSLFSKLIPSYRVGQSILTEEYKLSRNLYYLNQKIDALQQTINNVEEKNEYYFWLTNRRDEETLEETKKRLFLNFPKATGKLREIQLAENYILQRVKDICDANNIHFWLAYGTLIGAVRHHGFIPWDDDIDICMLKKDCDKLFSILKNDSELEINKFFQINAAYITKVKFKGDDSIFVDIFTLDYVDCISEADAIEKFEETQRVSQKCQNFNDKLLNKFDYNCYNITKPFKCEKIIDLVDENYNKETGKLRYYGFGKYIGLSICMSTFFRNDEKFCPAEWYFPLAQNSIEFEGKMYDAPANIDKVLENMYGNIWSLPSCISALHLDEFEGCEEIIKRFNIK